MIKADNLTKYFGSFRALEDISFEINQGEIVGFLGQNGAGKTTLMRILTTYLKPTSGKAVIFGKDVVKNQLEVRRMIGYLPEVPPIYFNMTVLDNLKFAAKLKEVPAKDEKRQIDFVLSQCDIENVRKRTVSTLSKGFKQRVGIASAILNDPKILILDEPTSGLDPLQIHQIRNLIKNLEHKRIVILSTHILSEIEQIAKRVLIIKEGRIIVDNLSENILKDTGKTNLEEAFLKLVGFAKD